MNKYIVIFILSLISFCSFPMNKSLGAEPLDENIFQWVQSTPRSNYFFNKQAMTYEIGPDGYANTNILIVPTVRTFDNMQIQDIIMKRQWRNLSTYRFNELVGVAEYLRIDLQAKTVEYTDCIYLDQGYNSLYVKYERSIQNINTMSIKDVDYNFYQTIIAYEQEHRKELLTNIMDKVCPNDLKVAGIKLDKDKKSEKREKDKRRN